MGYLEDENKNLVKKNKLLARMDYDKQTESILDENPDHLIDDDEEDTNDQVMKEFVSEKELPLIQMDRLKWSNVIILSVLHLATIISYVYLCLADIKFRTIRFAMLIGISSGLGMSVGAHRLYAHKSFKARWPLQVFLLILQSMTMNGSAYSYARDHRTHHKNSDTKFDPKNPARGLFYSHVGWWLERKSDIVKQAGSKLDFTDLQNNPLVWFQHKYYTQWFLLFGVIMPTWIPVYFWNEDPWIAFSSCVVIRITVVLHHLFTVNSVAHYFGHRPYDFRIRPTDQRLINYLSFGEGNHNFHHTFPYDYRANERAQWEIFNPVTMFIQLCYHLGLVYDRRVASDTAIEGIIKRHGAKVVRDQPATLLFRIINAIFDWILGLLVDLWPLYPAAIFKLATGRPLFIF